MTIRQEKQEEELKRAAVENHFAEMQVLKDQITSMKERVHQADYMEIQMTKLHAEGFLRQDPEGNISVVDDMDERHMIR